MTVFSLSQVEQIEYFELTANASSVEVELSELSAYTLYSLTTAIWIKKGKQINLILNQISILQFISGHHFFIGRGMEYSKYFMTRPKPPQNLNVWQNLTDYEMVHLSWQPPVEVPPNNSINFYNVFVTVCSNVDACEPCKIDF